MPRGRPSAYKEEYCDMLIKHMSGGYSKESFAGLVGVTRKTLYNWFERWPDFAEAAEYGTEKSRLFWEGLGIRGAQGDENFNAVAYIFQITNRFRDEWKQRQSHEGQDGGPLLIQIVKHAQND